MDNIDFGVNESELFIIGVKLYLFLYIGFFFYYLFLGFKKLIKFVICEIFVYVVYKVMF